MANDMQLAFGDARTGALDCRPTPVCDPRPVCPACGGLECLCRPRFFAGQLLTEEDLNRLDHYIVAKNRLHNRHLFGTGVVCGIDVVCSPCDPGGSGMVTVRPGYALSPCGNDIIVCSDTSVNVCDLINRCRPKAPDDCMQPGVNREDCLKGDEQWVLAICYQETPSRGITALRGSSCSCGAGGGSNCSCGGAKAASQGSQGSYMTDASCGCGGGTTAQTAKTKSSQKTGPTPPQCEPTLICEGYTFAVYKVPPATRSQVDLGALIKRFICCLLPLLQQLTALPGAVQNGQLQSWLLDLIATVRDFLVTEGLYDCDIATRLSAVALPTVSDARAKYVNQWNLSVLAVFEILAAIFQKCLCAALLPPCPPAEMNDCVPIATLTVARDRCRVRQICNINNRRFLVTFPALEYWLSWLPLFNAWQTGGGAANSPIARLPGAIEPTLRNLIEKICCTPVSDWFGDTKDYDLQNTGAVNTPELTGTVVGVMQPMEATRAKGKRSSAAMARTSLHPFTQLLGESIAGGPTANAASLLLASMGARAADGSPLVSDVALEHPGEAMLIHQIVAPALGPLLPLFGGSSPGDLVSLRKSVDDLRTQVEAHKAEIATLRKASRRTSRGGNNGPN